MPAFCSAINCVNKRGKNVENSISFFRFPKVKNRCKLWVHKCRRQDLDTKSCEELNLNYTICSEHFDSSQYYLANNGGKRALVTAVPTIFNFANQPSSLNLKRKQPTNRTCLQDKIQKKEVSNTIEFSARNSVDTTVTNNISAVKTNFRNKYLLS
ncbi:52 kDa repressor of the inhibitor of the protein kinase-like [Hydra vulgaris]|uniref:52 kDa repressor of the inhibitor of the protein kinase-like n=1 Tax=Hydra vulgaris TaxID=6087 RepID=A0ABM4BA25_HYDVU